MGTELLSATERQLLDELFRLQAKNPQGSPALKFRANHEDHLKLLSEMVSLGWIEHRDTRYLATLIAVAELASTNKRAESILYLCGHMFERFRGVYRADPSAKLYVRNLERIVEMPIRRIRQALPYFMQAHLFGGYSTDLDASNAFVVLSEELLLRKSFSEVVEQHRGWIRSRKRDRVPLGLASKDLSGATTIDHDDIIDSALGAPRILRTPLQEYTVRHEIGRGALGIVLLAVDERSTQYAIKYLNADKSDAIREARFRNEIRFGQQTRHKNIVPVVDVGEGKIDRKKTLFFVMPHFGQTLRQAMETGLSAKDALAVFNGILDGLECAHSQDVWHRDLKPENILLSEDCSRICISDFGIAHFAQETLYASELTQVADRLANFRYAAPEQRNPRAKKDHRLDYYALGLMLNEMFTGEVPQGTGYRTVAEANPTLSYLDDLVSLLIRQRAEDRPGTAEDIRRYLKHAHAASERKRRRKRARSH